MESLGFGISVHSCHGKVEIKDSLFKNNGVSNYLGGNARFSYEICSNGSKDALKITNSTFAEGKSDIITHASGIAVFSLCSNLQITLDNVSATANSGGNIQILMDYFQAQKWNVIIENCVLSGGLSRDGAGLLISSKFQPSSTKCACYESHDYINIIQISNTKFLGNTANNSGASLYINLHESFCTSTKINITKCCFGRNYVSNKGSIVKIFKHDMPSIYKGSPLSVEAKVSETSFFNNSIEDNEAASILELININRCDLLNSSFEDNTGSAILLQNTNLVLSGRISFERNMADKGAGIRFKEQSYMFINNDTRVSFIGNTARKTGGAIYTQPSHFDTHRPCFFQPITDLNTTTKVADLHSENNMELVFANNSAIAAGDAIYSAGIDHCDLFGSFLPINNSWNSLSSDVFDSMFNFSMADNSNSTVSSDANKVYFCDSHHASSISRQVIPGKSFSVSIVAKGERDGIVSALITAKISPEYQNTTRMASIETVTTNDRLCTNYSITLETDDINSAIVVLMVKQKYPQYYTKHARILVSFEDCPWGFQYQGSYCRCIFTDTTTFKCDIETQNVQKHPRTTYTTRTIIWVGCRRERNESCQGKPILSIPCDVYGYCIHSVVNITADTIDNQCHDGRTGIACALCKQNYSIVLGTNRCLQCSNVYISLVSVYLLAGIVLIVLLAVFNITVTEGYLNGLIFYANFIHLNRSIFFPNFNNYNITRILIAWLNLDLGIEVCFYNGMTIYQKIWLEIAYVFYIWFLQITIIALCRRYVYFTRLLGRNIAKVMSTLLLLLFLKTVRIAQEIVRSVNTKQGVRMWRINSNIQYASTNHIPLIIVAALLMMSISALTFCLLFIQILIKLSGRRYFRWVARLYPFFETFTGPCNSNYAFWPGMLFFARIVLVIVYSFNHNLPSTKLAVTSGTTIIIIVFSFLSSKGVYKKWSLNLLEFSIFLNLSISMAASIFYNTTSIYVSVWMTFFFFASFHFVNRFSKIKVCFVTMKNWKKLISEVSFQKREENCPHSANVATHSEVALSFGESNEHSLLLPAQDMPPVVQQQ